jgi:hypothetical protein
MPIQTLFVRDREITKILGGETKGLDNLGLAILQKVHLLLQIHLKTCF